MRHTPWLCALALLVLFVPPTVPASHPACTICCTSCVNIVKIAKEADVTGVGPTPPPLYDETYLLAHTQLDFWIGRDHGSADLLVVRDDAPFSLNGSAGPARWQWAEEDSSTLGRVYVTNVGVQKVGELWRVEVQVVNGEDVILALPGRMVYLDGASTVAPVQPGELSDSSRVVGGFADDTNPA